MSYVNFKEVQVNNPGTSTTYGSDDLNEIMQIFNAKIVSNRQVKLKNPWVFQDALDVQAASAVPGNPPANTKRFYVDPSDNSFRMKSTAGTIVNFDTLGAGALGEANTASNIGTAGVGVFKEKSAVDLRFKKINAGSTKVTITDDTTNNEVDIDVTEANLSLLNIAGVLTVAKGGTGLNTLTSQALLKGNGTGNVSLIAAGTNGQILTMVSGAPVWAAASASSDIKTQLMEAGVNVSGTSAGRKLNFSNGDDFTISEDTTANDRFDLALVRSEVLTGVWSALNNSTGGGIVKSNLGSTYVDLFPTVTDSVMGHVDGTGKNNFRFTVSWHKRGGGGTHSARLISTTSADVLAEISTLNTGTNTITGTIPTYFQDNVRTVVLQAKSTTSSDDPEFYSASLWYK